MNFLTKLFSKPIKFFEHELRKAIFEAQKRGFKISSSWYRRENGVELICPLTALNLQDRHWNSIFIEGLRSEDSLSAAINIKRIYSSIGKNYKLNKNEIDSFIDGFDFGYIGPTISRNEFECLGYKLRREFLNE